MRPRRALPLLAVVLAATLLIACGKQPAPAPSGVSTATPTPTARATETPRLAATATATATVTATSQAEATLMKALLQRADVPGSNWTVQDISARELAAATQQAAGQASAPDLQGLVATCYPGQPTPGAANTPGVARAFVTAPPTLSMVISTVATTPNAAKAVEAMRTLKIDAARTCLENAMKKGLGDQMPGATVELVSVDSVSGLPANAAGFTLVLRITASGITLTQHLATLTAAQDQIFASTIALTMAEGATTPALPVAADRLGTLAAQRVSEARR